MKYFVAFLVSVLLVACGGGGDESALSPASAHKNATTALVEPDNGWWWNPAESGSGYSIERQGNQIFMASYLYETSGVATWYVAGLTRQSSGAYSGAMQRYSGGQTLLGSYKPPASNTSVVANALLSFNTASSGTLTITFADGSPSRTVALERFAFTPPAAIAPSNASFENGWWWNEAESGRGYFIEVQGSVAFIASYMFDSTGQPTWYVSVAALQGSQSLSGALDQYTNGQSLGGSYKPATKVATSAGVTSFNFSNSTTANLILPNGSSVALKRFIFNTAIDPNFTVPFQNAAANLVKSGFSKPFTVTGWIDNSTSANPLPRTPITGSGILTIGAPSGTETIQGVAALSSTKVMTETITFNGQPSSSTSTAVIYVDLATYATVATIAGNETIYYKNSAYPATVKAGDAGSLGTGKQATFISPTTTDRSYLVTSESANSLLITMIENRYKYGGWTAQTQTVYRVTTSGSMALVSITTEYYGDPFGGSHELLTYRFEATPETANVAPIANAGAIQNVVVGTVVTLNGNASSDANSDPLTYVWTLTTTPAGSAATLASSTSARPTFTADVVGTYVASLIVNDGKTSSAAATVAVTATVASVPSVPTLKTYNVIATRAAQNFYTLASVDTILQTKYCYEYAYSESATLTMRSSTGYSDGTITFANGTSCDVAGAYGPTSLSPGSYTATLTIEETGFYSDSIQRVIVRTDIMCYQYEYYSQSTLVLPYGVVASNSNTGTIVFGDGTTCNLTGVYGLERLN